MEKWIIEYRGVIGLIVGLIAGGCIGILAASLCAMGKTENKEGDANV